MERVSLTDWSHVILGNFPQPVATSMNWRTTFREDSLHASLQTLRTVLTSRNSVRIPNPMERPYEKDHPEIS